MTDLYAAFTAGRVRRWHTNTHLAGTDDRVDGHAGRVARIILAWHTDPSLALIKAALLHDDGEAGTADLSHPVKDAMRRKNPESLAAFEAEETICRDAIWGRLWDDLSTREAAWLRFADRLDAYMWAAFHGADMTRHGWPEAMDSLWDDAKALGVTIPLRRMLDQIMGWDDPQRAPEPRHSAQSVFPATTPAEWHEGPLAGKKQGSGEVEL